jgi:hypothetical protein
MRWWRQCRWYLLAGLHPSLSQQWFRWLASPATRRYAMQHPQLVVKPLRPYLNRWWSVSQRAKVIADTHELARRVPIIEEALSRPEGVCLVQGNWAEADAFEVHLGRDQRFRKEGELVLALVTDKRTEALCSLSLAFEYSADGTLICYIGSIRGRDGGSDALKAFAQAWHGTRAHSLLLDIARQLARHAGASTLLGAGNAIHVHRTKRLPHRPFAPGLSQDYDELWQALGGCLQPDGWYRLTMSEARSERSDIPTHERAQYQRRYEWLDQLGAALHQRFRIPQPA